MSLVRERNYQKESMAMDQPSVEEFQNTSIYNNRNKPFPRIENTRFAGFVTLISSKKLDFTTHKLRRACIDAIRVHPSSTFAKGKNLWQIQD